MASDIKLVFYSSTITMMHGPIKKTGENALEEILQMNFPQLTIGGRKIEN